MELTIRAAIPAERLFAYEQNVQIAEKCGSPGFLLGQLDSTGTMLRSHWERCAVPENTPEFKAEFDTVLDMLRFDERYGHALKNRAAMIAFCLDHPEAELEIGQEYTFRADTDRYAYLVRCTPNGEDHQLYVHPYDRKQLDRHMKQAEKGIPFITPQNKEKFRVPDGERLLVTTSGAGTRVNTARYVDDSHFVVVTSHGGFLYHIHEFAEWLERHEGKVIPLRSTLPDQCYSVLPSSNEIIIIKKGEDGYYHTDKYGHDRESAQAIADEYNERDGVTKAQEAAMLAGSMFGWAAPGADPKNYDAQGNLLKPKHQDRGDAR